MKYIASLLLVLFFSTVAWAGSVILEWDPNTEPDLAGYKIYYKIGSSGEPYNGTGAAEGDSPIDVGNVTEFILSGLTEGLTYYFVATAYDTEGLESDYSNEVNAQIGSGIDLFPPIVTGTTPTNDTTPTWSWSPGGGGNGTYRYKLDDSDLTSGVTQTTDTSYTSVTDLPDGSHILYVQERDEDENWSSSGSFAIVIDTTPPDAPTNLTVIVVDTSTPPATFVWFGADDEPGDRDGTTVANYTYIFDEAITVSGTIIEIQVYVADASGGVLDFAVFRNTSGSSFSNDHAALGLNITNGPNVFKSANGDFDPLPVDVGEYIGFFITSDGLMDRWQTGGPGPGYMYDSGDQIGAAPNSTTFTISGNTGYELQIRVKIEE